MHWPYAVYFWTKYAFNYKKLVIKKISKCLNNSNGNNRLMEMAQFSLANWPL